jgi:flagellar basal-body rod protein FlgF
MGRDLYAALSGAYTSMRRLDTVAQNLANVSTTGYKAQRLTTEATGQGGAYARIAEGLYDMQDGAVVRTDHPTDVAVQGNGWLVLDGGTGAMLTRDGRMRPDADGTLRDPNGHAVMGQLGTIQVPLGETVRIEADGTVVGSESGPIDRLRVVAAAAAPMGGNVWAPEGPMTDLTEGEVQLVPGAVEGSNVDPMRAMVELVEASRTFEAFQKAMQTSDDTDARLNELGRS